MGMLQGGPDMRFPPGHNPMMPRGMAMRGRPMPGAIPGGMPMGGLGHNPQMHGGMGFPPNMMPGGPGGMVRRAVSNPALNPSLAGLNGQTMMQQQQQHQQQHQLMRQQQMQAHVQQERQRMEIAAMMNARGQPGNPQNPAVGRTGSAGQLMNSLSQPPSLNQPPHPGGMPGHNFQNPIAPPPPSSSPRARTPVMNIPSGPGPSQPPLNRAHMSEEMFMNNFPQNQYPSRMGNGQQFPFGTSPTPPLNMNDSFPPGAQGRPSGFPPTPAQQLMQQHGGTAAAENGFGFPMAPQRPPSNNQHPMMQQQHSPPQQPSQHHSPHHSDPMNSHPPRPQSQPQPQQPPGRPLSSAGPSHTPRPAPQSGLPSNPGLLPGGRLPSSAQQPQPPPQTPNQNMRPQSSSGSSSHQQPIAPRPPPPPQAPPAPSSESTLSSASPPDANAMLAASAIPRHPAASAQMYSIGFGQGLMRVMQFSGLLGVDAPTVQSQKLHLSYWDNLVREYFTPKALVKLTLWRDSLKNEAKPFEIGVPILPRFFLVTTQSGVKSMSLTLDGARERLYQPGHAIVECVSAVWTCRYSNGHIVTLRGPLTAHLIICTVPPQSVPPNGASPPYVLKFDDFEFDATSHDKYIALESISGARRTEEAPPPTPANGVGSGSGAGADEDKKWEEPRQIIDNASIPGEPVNAFGIPQATMRCLELAESVGQMAELISFAKEQEVGPLDALKSLADKIREEQPQLTMMNGFGTNNFFPGGSSSMPSAAHGTLYSSAPASVTNPASTSQQPSSSMSSPPKCLAVCAQLATEAA
ncbi:hypothetical protein MSAN_01400600 [Mycena sanguinolenta]|uniref:Uncharacterized protein n=1 Tax=Mycena sanguinolenta TaxID=230812 RepID=A0A8H6YAJ5_9AGAR|nr:hypothetical protein MSAN_01400600 [Mycena sanguinolenta]